jgi:5-carboxymethyl-2-hydroxymuconate isomerase
MPSVLIETRQPNAATHEQAIMEAVHRALCDAFAIPIQDKNIRLVAHEPHRFACPPGRAKPEAFTYISIDAFVGRSLAAKRNLYRSIVDNLEPLGIPKDHVTIALRELPVENWGIRGGQAACDVDLGFKINV